MSATLNGQAVADRSLTVVHAIPGRLRLRVPSGARVEGLAERVAGLKGVVGSTWSSRTGSLLVRYEPASITADAITATAAEHAAVAGPEASDLIVRTPPPGERRSLATAVTEAFADANRRVARVTGGVIDLGGLVPTVLVLWALGELLRGRTAPLAWSSALWYAHGLFRDYNVPAVRE